MRKKFAGLKKSAYLCAVIFITADGFDLIATA